MVGGLRRHLGGLSPPPSPSLVTSLLLDTSVSAALTLAVTYWLKTIACNKQSVSNYYLMILYSVYTPSVSYWSILVDIRGGPKFGFVEFRPNYSAERFRSTRRGNVVLLGRTSAELRCYSVLFSFHLQRRTLRLFTLIFLAHDVFLRLFKKNYHFVSLAFDLASIRIRKRFYY